MQIHELLICIAFALLGLGLFKRTHLKARKIGLLILWLGSGLGVYFLTDTVAWGLVMLLVWILIPLSEIVLVLRKLRLPRKREFQDANPPLENFHVLRDVTMEFQELGFQKVDDCDLTPHFHETYYRLFYHQKHPSHGVIGFISQGEIGFSFNAFFSEQEDGKIWLTWDYPLTYGLKTPPSIQIYRVNDAQDISDLWEQHQEFLKINEVPESQLVMTQTASDVRERLLKSLNGQLDYNIQQGILFPEGVETPHLRYSWRGIWFVARQMARDIIRVS